MKRVLISIILITLSVVLSMPIFAISNVQEVHNLRIVSPSFTNISYVKADLNIENDDIAHVQTMVTARNVDKIVINMSLQRYEYGNWKVLNSWLQTTYGSESVLYKTMTVSRGYRYRILSNVDCYFDNKLCETSTITSDEILLN